VVSFQPAAGCISLLPVFVFMRAKRALECGSLLPLWIGMIEDRQSVISKKVSLYGRKPNRELSIIKQPSIGDCY
jgi:hypothetical protein